MELTYYAIALVLALAIALIAGLFVSKSSKRKKTFVMATILAVGGILLFVAYPQGSVSYTAGSGLSLLSISDAGGNNIPSPSDLKVDVTGCDLGTKTTVTLSASDKYNSSATGGTHRYRINGAPALTVADAGTFTASPGDKLDVLWQNAGTSGYFSKPDSFTVPCTGAKTFTAQLAVNGSITSTVFNANDQVITGSTNQTLTAGDVKDVKVKLSGTFQRDFPNGFVAVVEYNKTALDDVKLTSNGVEYGLGTLPQSYTRLFAGTASSTKTYVLPGLISNADLEFKATLDADDTYNPEAGSGTENVTITYYALNYFVNEDKSGAFDVLGAEDEDNSVTRVGQYKSTIYYD